MTTVTLDDDTAYETTIGRLYEAALEPGLWREAVGELARYVGAEAFHLFAWDARAQRPQLSVVSHEHFESVARDYEQGSGEIDVVRDKALALAPGTFMATQDHFSDRFVAQSPWFQEFLIPNGMCWTQGGIVPGFDGVFTVLALLRGADRGRYDAVSLQRGQRAWSHFNRATSLYLRTEALRARADVGQDTLDAVDFGVIAIDARGAVVHANAAARAIGHAGRALCLRAGAVRAVEPREDQRLAQAITVAAERGTGCSLTLGARLDAGAQLHVSVAPLSERTSIRNLLGSPSVLLLLRERGRQRILTEHQLMDLFRLSPAEARFARAMAHGLTPEGYAQQAGLTLSTVRTQQRKVYDKTGCAKATELVRLLVSLPAVRPRRR